MSGPSFAEEFPHITKLSRTLARYLLAFACAVLVTVICAALGAPKFLAGWFTCMTWLAVSGQLRFAQ